MRPPAAEAQYTPLRVHESSIVRSFVVYRAPHQRAPLAQRGCQHEVLPRPTGGGKAMTFWVVSGRLPDSYRGPTGLALYTKAVRDAFC